MNATADQPIENHLAIPHRARGVVSRIMVRFLSLAPDAAVAPLGIPDVTPFPLRHREEQNAAEPSAVAACAR